MVACLFVLTSLAAFADNIDDQIREQERIIDEARKAIAEYNTRLENGDYGAGSKDGLGRNAIERDIYWHQCNIEGAKRKITQLKMIKNRPKVDIQIGGPQNNTRRGHNNKKNIQNQANKKAKIKREQQAAEREYRKQLEEENRRKKEAEDRERRERRGVEAQRVFDEQNQAALQYKLNMTQRNNQNLHNIAQNSGFEERQRSLRGNATGKPAPPKGYVRGNAYKNNTSNSQIQMAPPPQFQRLVVPMNTDY